MFFTMLDSRVEKAFNTIHWESKMGFPGRSAGKEYTCNAGDPSSIPGSGRSSGEWIGYPLQYSCLENPQGQRNHRVAKSWTRLSN